MKDYKNNTKPAVLETQQSCFIETELEATCLNSNPGIKAFEVGKTLGNGNIQFIALENGLQISQFDISLFDDFTFKLSDLNTNTLHFIYGLEGECYHCFSNSDKSIAIEELRTAILVTKPDIANTITIKKNRAFRFTILSLENPKYFSQFETRYHVDKAVIEKLEHAFLTLNHGLHICNYNLKIADQLRLLKTTRDEFKITSLLYLESHFQIVLGIHLEHFYKEMYETRIETPLNKTELLKIRKITEYIIDKPMLRHTIKNLCSEAILSPVKLQEGFRCIHGTTVSNYVRNVRVEKARDLLIYTDNNVSEVAYMVGFTSRSYFCKIFKEKYGCNATAYRDKYKDASVNLNTL